MILPPSPPLIDRLRLRARAARRAAGRRAARAVLVRLLEYLPAADLDAAVEQAHARRTARLHR